VTRDTATNVAGLLRGLEGRIGPKIAAAGFARGTRMLFQQSTAPAGWTKDATINDKALRVTSGSVGSGGSKGLRRHLAAHGSVGPSLAASAVAPVRIG
jgi:hypothetical protein